MASEGSKRSTPQRLKGQLWDTSLNGPSHLMHSASKSGVLALGDWKNPPQKTKKQPRKGVHKITHAQKRNPLSDLYKILCCGKYPRRNHPCQFWLQSVKGFLGGKSQISPFPIGFHCHPYNTLTLPCEYAMKKRWGRKHQEWHVTNQILQ